MVLLVKGNRPDLFKRLKNLVKMGFSPSGCALMPPVMPGARTRSEKGSPRQLFGNLPAGNETR
jgi:hypothetical protein